MGAIASLITSLTIVYPTVYSDADQRKHQSSASLAFARGIHRVPVNYPHKWLVTRKMFPFDDVIMSLRISCELKSRETPFARNLQFSSLPVVYFRTGHGSRTAILCAKFHNDLETDKYVMGKREFTVFISKQITIFMVSVAVNHVSITGSTTVYSTSCWGNQQRTQQTILH